VPLHTCTLGPSSFALGGLPWLLPQIRERPRRDPIAYAQVHRALIPRFHFAIFFESVEERAEIVILAALHQRRDPAAWPRR